MKVAFISDVHANLPALEAVLKHARAEGAEVLWNGGDFVGYGPFPDESVRLLREVCAASVIGNYDLKVLKFPRKDARWRRTKEHRKWLAFKWAFEHLSEESIEYLRSLPRRLTIPVGNAQILLTHGSPDSVSEYLDDRTPEERLHEIACETDVDVVLSGHAHRASERRVGGILFVNAGPVGRADDGDPRACYAILEFSAKNVSVAHHRVRYDVQRAVDAIRDRGLPVEFARMLIEGRDLGAVEDE